MEEALLWNRESGKLRCELCSWRCLIPEGESGFCGVRVNKDGTLRSKNYGKILIQEEHPIEKLPMFHFFPRSTALFLGSFGCNMRCKFCTHADISRKTGVRAKKITPEEIIRTANEKNIKIIAFTYTEPTVNFEFAFKVARLAKRYNIKTVFDTNGFITSDGVKKIGKYLDAVTVDIKASLDPEFYKKYMSVDDVQPIRDALKSFRKHRVFIEISNLVVPEIGDNKDLNKQFLEWVIENLGSSVPYHLLTFNPSYKMQDSQSTPLETLEDFTSTAKRIGLRYIYVDSMWGGTELQNTYCYNCGALVIERMAKKVKNIHLIGDRCPTCGFKIDVVRE